FHRYSAENGRVYTVAVDVRNQAGLALCEKKGFRRYAAVEYYQATKALGAAVEPTPPPARLRPLRSRDAAMLAELYQASTPAAVRLVDSRTPADFEVGLIERTMELWRRRWHECEEMRYVVDGPERSLIGYLRILGQYRGEAPHTLQIATHPAYPDLLPELLRFALGKLRGFPGNAAMTWSASYHPHKRAAFVEAGLQLVTEDVCLVKDTFIPLKLPLQPLKTEELGAFRPAYCDPVSNNLR
ncbi:MAG: hypothetical protein HY692_06860, partial [Cyanobacteria bacterium NC_groundwater_1444_Ag_S-0.65um_54_12]|nr:hypothetical protein [Cyanobacteria bacterium NC_groundwater_1444_Ag_S-0.65um_54_12]